MRVLEKKHSLAILLYLAKNDGATSKLSLQKELGGVGGDKTVLKRIKELSEIGLISCTHASVNKHNSYIVNLTDNGREIANRLVECESYMEAIR